MTTQQDWVNFSLQRPNYFPGQYLLDEDFDLAHRYLSDRQRYINSRLHLAGIVEGLQVETIAGQPEVVIKSGTAIDGKGNLIILKDVATQKITSDCWVCLSYREEPKLLQQPEIPDSFTRLEEVPLLTLEAIAPTDAKTVTLAHLTLENGQVKVDNTVRQYSGVRLPSGSEEIALQSSGDSLAIKGKLSIAGALQLGDVTVNAISDAIDTERDRADVIPSEKAVKAYVEWVKERLETRFLTLLTDRNLPTQEKEAISLDTKPDGLYGWKTEGGEASDVSSLIKLVSYRANEKTTRLTIERDTGKVDINGSIRARHVVSTNPMHHRMYPNDAIVYQDIFEAEAEGKIKKTSNLSASSYNNTSYVDKRAYWARPMIRYGSGKEDQGGALVTLPPGYDTVWIRIGNSDQWHIVKALFSQDGKTFQDLGNWTAGKRYANHYCPDGSLSDSTRYFHEWLPIPVGKAGQVKLVHKNAGIDFWLSGVAFSKNPWAHATQSALGYHWVDQVNGGQAVDWESDNWNDDVLATIDNAGYGNVTNVDLRVPVVPSGRDKLLYMVEHNGGWNGCSHTAITINVKGKEIPIGERFLATYDNPFARHWSSKMYNRYIAARIPANLLADALQQAQPGERITDYVTVKIDTSTQCEVSGKWEDRLKFRELGTHDLEVPDFI